MTRAEEAVVLKAGDPMTSENGKSTDDLLQLIGNRQWSEGDSHKYDLDQYGVSDTELPIILQKVKDRGLDYKLSKASNGKSTLKVYSSSASNIRVNVRAIIASFLLIVSVIAASLISVLLMVFVYSFFTFASKVLGNGWISIEDFCNSYWDFLAEQEN